MTTTTIPKLKPRLRFVEALPEVNRNNNGRPKGGTTIDWDAIANALAGKPGQWAKVDGLEGVNGVNKARAALSGRGSFEVVGRQVRNNEGTKVRVFVRATTEDTEDTES